MFGTQKGLEDAMPHITLITGKGSVQIRKSDEQIFYSSVYPKIQQTLPAPFK